MVWANRDTMRPVDDTVGQPPNPDFSSNDDLGDTLATPFAGPATDVEQSVFLMRRLPLAVGFKTTLPVTSNQFSPTQMQLSVTGIETVQTSAGKFNCYKVSFAGIGQTFWIGVEGARPLVKFRSGSVEAELVKVWGAENPAGLSGGSRAGGRREGVCPAHGSGQLGLGVFYWPLQPPASRDDPQDLHSAR